MTGIVIDMALARERRGGDPAALVLLRVQKRREEDSAREIAEYRADPAAYEARSNRDRIEAMLDELERRAS